MIELFGIFERHLGRLFLPPGHLPSLTSHAPILHSTTILKSLALHAHTPRIKNVLIFLRTSLTSPFTPRMAAATNDATKDVTRSTRSMKDGAEKLSHVPAKRRASQKNGAGLIPPATSKKPRASSAAKKKAALSKEVDDERAMAEALAANRAEGNEKAFHDVAMQDTEAMLAGSSLATQETLLSGASKGLLEEAGAGDAATLDCKSTPVTAGVEQTFDCNSNNVTAAA